MTAKEIVKELLNAREDLQMATTTDTYYSILRKINFLEHILNLSTN